MSLFREFCLSQLWIGAICGHSRHDGVGTEVGSNQERNPDAGAGLCGFARARVFVSRHLSAWSVSWAGQSECLWTVSWGRQTGAPWWVLPAGTAGAGPRSLCYTVRRRFGSGRPVRGCAHGFCRPRSWRGWASILPEAVGRLVLSRTLLPLVETPVPQLLCLASLCLAVTAWALDQPEVWAEPGLGHLLTSLSSVRLLLCWLVWARTCSVSSTPNSGPLL